MISLGQAAALPAAQLTPDELAMLDEVSSKVDEAVRTTFDGLGAHLVVPADKATARVVAELVRRLEAPAADGTRWHISVGTVIRQAPPLIQGGPPRFELLSYLLSVAADQVSEQFMRTRRETAR